jgi:hypothetical protein
MNRDAWRVQQRVDAAWQAVVSGMQTMYPASVVRPAQLVEAFELDNSVDDSEVKFNIKPIVFNVPERATRQDANLYVAITGWLSFEGPDFQTLPMKTKSFGTEVAYFRSKVGALEHVYGAHYDLDEQRAGHPVFHAQVSPKVAMVSSVNDRFGKDFQNVEDLVGRVLGNVRTPSAQMDVFAVMLQICADHLIHSGSPPNVIEAFNKMRAACEFFIGAAYRIPTLNQLPATQCYRSMHWYARSEGQPQVIAAA